MLANYKNYKTALVKKMLSINWQIIQKIIYKSRINVNILKDFFYIRCQKLKNKVTNRKAHHIKNTVNTKIKQGLYNNELISLSTEVFTQIDGFGFNQ